MAEAVLGRANIEDGSIAMSASASVGAFARRSVKATRGRVRTPKAGAKWKKPFRQVSHEVLWSAMRPRIALEIRLASRTAHLTVVRLLTGLLDNR